MTVFGKRVSDYARFARVFLALIVIVGLIRLALSMGGVPTEIARWASVTALIWIGVFYFAVRVHTTGFGSYRELLPIYVLQMVAAQAVIVPAIILAIATGRDNIFSVPEFAFGADGKTWSHVLAHLFIGTTVGSLFGWIVGCLVMLVTKKATRNRTIVPVAGRPA
jgi:hypothetical protein